MTELQFRFLEEDRPGDGWRQVVDHGWPGWREWFEARGGNDGPSAAACRRAIRRHLPGIEGLLETLVEAVDGDAQLARFLTFWSPPRYLVNCTQLAVTDADGPLLIRNYDLDPQLNEATMLRTGWLGRPVVGMVEAMAGLSDGMNADGLAVSLTFGGRVARGDGFGIPLVIRYILEFCRDVQDALAVLRDMPCHMSYNVTLTDPMGAVATVMLAPDRPTMVSHAPWATNHQLGVEWPHHGRLTRTIERAERIDHILAARTPGEAELKHLFLTSPIFSARYAQGFGTVYTTVYRPAERQVQIGWGDGAFTAWDLGAPPPAPIRVRYDAAGSRRLGDAPAVPEEPAPWWNQRLEAFQIRNRAARALGWTNLNVEVGAKPDRSDQT